MRKIAINVVLHSRFLRSLNTRPRLLLQHPAIPAPQKCWSHNQSRVKQARQLNFRRRLKKFLLKPT